ncbi:MAG: RNA-binding protein [Elusimicrobiota bacterium]
MGNNLFVTGFPYELTQEDLGELFAECGRVVSVKILMGHETGRSRGIAFVVMAKDAEAQAAIKKLNGTKVGQRRIFVTEARPSEKPDGGGYTGPERRSGKDRRRSPPAAAGVSSERRPGYKDRKPGFGDKKPWKKKPWDKDRKPGSGDKKPWEKKPWDKDRKPGSGDKKPGKNKPWDKKPGFGSKKKWGAGGPSGGRKPGGFKRKPSGGFRGK